MGHVQFQGAEKARFILNAVNANLFQFYPGVLPRKRAIRPLEHDLFATNLWAYVPDEILLTDDIKEAVALGIWMEYHMIYEDLQLRYDFTAGLPFVPPPSGFSEEDLPSNIVGFYLHTKGYQPEQQLIGEGGEVLYEPLNELCDVMTKEESLLVYDNVYFHPIAGQGFQSNWREWERRPLPVNQYFDTFKLFVEPHRSCGSHEWPAELRQFSQKAIQKTGEFSIYDLTRSSKTLPINGWYKLSNAGLPGFLTHRSAEDIGDFLVPTSVPFLYRIKESC